MGFSVSVSHGHGLSSQLSSSSLHAQQLSSSSSKSTLFVGFPFTSYASTLHGKQCRSQPHLLVFSKRVSGLEEALRIRRFAIPLLTR
ncbi:methionine aminopeptidase 1B, chloroplastic [Gossypium australe]|uniref:Methionine aminopeptidase 1B, chloroplastic n=1 Tax=Gossypium australe TaxID=47621 RepID=A0A5B6UTA9_9ROSI|nr:methionine aminopeptidase 1B, chloroplastic [Gossypium australe]